MTKTKTSISLILIGILFFVLFQKIPHAFAFEATSTTFELHAGNIQSISGSATSATFKNVSAGGQLSTGISSVTKKVWAGVLYWLQGVFKPVYEQIHYRWRNDDGTEVTATFPVNEDTVYVSFPTNTVKRLRFEISNNSWTRAGSTQFSLEVASTTTCSSGTYTGVGTSTAQAWVLATSTNITDGLATTNVASGLTDNGNTFMAGQVKTTASTTSAITLTSGQFTEIEYGVMATASSTPGGQYCFRLTNNGTTTNYMYTAYAQANLVSGLPAVGTLDSGVFDTTGTSTQGPAYNSIMWTGNQNGSLGGVHFQLATSDCPNGQTNAPTCSTGTWSFIGGSSCNTNGYYDTTGPNAPVEISCSPAYHNNQRYYRYRVQLCSANCSASGQFSPIVDSVIVNWAP